MAPYLVVTGTGTNPGQVFLAAEQALVCEIDDPMAYPAALLALYYTLNTTFPKSSVVFYCCLEVLLLGNTSGKVPPAISAFMTSLN